MDLSQAKLAAHIGVPVRRFNEIVRGKRGITPDTAWLLSHALGTTPQLLGGFGENPRHRRKTEELAE